MARTSFKVAHASCSNVHCAGPYPAPAQKIRAMPKAVAGDMIEADLDNQFRA